MERPNFKRSPAADGKKLSFHTRIFDRIKEKLMGGTRKSEFKAEDYMDLRMMWQSRIRRLSRAPERKNGPREMSRRVQQMANGTHGL